MNDTASAQIPFDHLVLDYGEPRLTARDCGDRQIEGAKVGLAHGLGSACGVQILVKSAA